MRYLIFLFLIVSKVSEAQKTISYAGIDSASYAQFMSNDYKALKKTSRNARREKIDFYYLRMRIGILAYDKKNYDRAIQHLEKAYGMNPADTIAQEYLYYAYLFSNRIENANKLASVMSSSLQLKIGFRVKKIDNISLGLADFNNKNVDNESINFISPSYKRGDAVLNGSTTGLSFAIENTFKYRTRFYNKVSIFNTHSLGIEQFGNIVVTTPSSFTIPASKKSVSYSNIQFQYNFGISHQTKRGYLFSGGFGYYNTNTSDLLAKPSPPMNMQPPTMQYSELKTSYSNYSFSGTFGKRMKYFFPSVSMSFSNLYDAKQVQNEFSLTYYPFGNVNFYGGASLAMINNDRNRQGVLTQKIGFKITKWLWLDVIHSIGNHANYISGNGFTVYNTADPILSNSNVNLHFYFKKMELTLGYSNQIREAKYDQYTSQTEYTTRTYKYTNNNIMTTIKWNF